MSATEPVYLYSRGNRRHLLDPAVPLHKDGHYGTPLCQSTWFETDAEMVAQLTRWNPAATAARYIDRMRALPVCKVCTKKHEAPS